MQIPKNLPQFNELPALFVTAGEYEACFFLAHKGELKLQQEIKMPPREEAKEKQGFIGRKSGMQSFVAVSHKGRYIEDLKKKFQKKFHSIIHDVLAEFKLEEIYLFAPKYVASRMMKGLSKPEQKDVRMEFFQQDTKLNPLSMVKKFWKLEEKNIFPEPIPGNNAQKILSKPSVK